MSLTLETKEVAKGSAAAGGVMPEWAKIPTVIALFGLSKSMIYREAARGKIILKKNGRSTLVNVPSARDYIASLPDAELSPPRDSRGAAAVAPKSKPPPAWRTGEGGASNS